jgi:methyltransferase
MIFHPRQRKAGVIPMYVFLIMALVTAQRLTEFVYSYRNSQILKQQGGYEVGRFHYVLLVIMHAAWLISLWWFAWDQPVYWAMFIVYLLIQVIRAWTLMALGPRWTIEIIVTPDEVIQGSPTHFIKQPNYLITAAEILILPLTFGLWWHAILFTIINGMMLYWRMRIENEAIAPVKPDSSVTGL